MIGFVTSVRQRARKRRALEQKVSPKILRRALRRPELVQGASAARTLTFLNCRIRGFDSIVESLKGDPSALTRLTRCALTPLTQAVLDKQGTIDRVAADGFSAFFNAPLDDEHHATHACECALAMLQALEKANRALEHAASAGAAIGPVGIGIGVSTGAGIVGDFGTARQPMFTAAAPAAMQSAELERLSQHYAVSVLVASSTHGAAENDFAFLEVDVVRTKSGEPQPIYALIGSPVSRANPKFLALKAFHERIFDAYRAREWAAARTLIEQCRGLSGANPVLYDLYLERIARLELDPTRADWSGRLEPAPV